MEIQKTITLWQKKILETSLVQRSLPNIDDYLKLGKIISILGGRRTGKTYIMIQIVRSLIDKQNIDISQIVFLDFAEWSNHKLNLIEICEYYEAKSIKPFFVLDEIQELEEFERQLVYIYNQQYPCIISGSNSKMLSQDISTKLRWRVVEIYNDVLDFNEYLSFKQSIGSALARNQELSFLDYMQWWGYPEVVLTDTVESKKSLLKSYFDVMIYKDLIDRYKIRNQEILNILLKYIIKSTTKPFNTNKIFNNLKSQWFAVSKNTVYEYIQYIQNIFFVSKLGDFYKNSYFEKNYLIDNGFLTIFDDDKNLWQKFENIVYKKLHKKYENNLGFVQDKFDIDFTNGKINRQACIDLNLENQNRETKFALSKQENIIVYLYKSSISKDNLMQQSIFEFLV